MSILRYIAGPLLILILSLAVLGCEGRLAVQPERKGDTKMEESNQELGAVSLETAISLQDGKLSVEYRIKNRSREAIYVFNRLWDFGLNGNYVPAPQPFYILLDDSGKLHLAKVIPALPKSKRVELKIVPFATKVEAGAEFSEKFDLAEPLSEYNPYFPLEKSDSVKSASSDSVVLSVDYVAETEGMEVKAAPLEGALTVWHPALAERVRTLSSRPKTSVVKVQRRTDSFERF